MKNKDLLKEALTWTETGDPEFPYMTVNNRTTLRVRINDFPAEHLFTLVGAPSEFSFDDWPAKWKKSAAVRKTRTAAAASRVRKRTEISVR